jgi:D-amino-acid dehydrogenase
MRAIVIGGGVVGVTTAYELHSAGLETTLLEQREGPGLETSFANAGSVCASRAGPWASPRTIAKTLKGYLKEDSPFRLKVAADGLQFAWLAGFARAAFGERRALRRRAMIELGIMSQRRWHEVTEDLGLEYGPVGRGLLTVHDDAADLALATADLPFLQSLGLDVRRLSPEECRAAEPAAHLDDRVLGGILARDDESADCNRFTVALASHLHRAGVDLRFGTRVRSISARDGAGCRVQTAAEELRSDVVVVAAGGGTRPLLAPLGVRIPTYPVKGYSITVRHESARQPALTIADEGRKVFVAPLDGHLRAAGVADIRGDDRTLHPRRIATLRRTVARLYPGADVDGELSAWTGLRDMTCDGPPVISPVGETGIWINSGHGSLGWTFACGAAALVAALVTGNPQRVEARWFRLGDR